MQVEKNRDQLIVLFLVVMSFNYLKLLTMSEFRHNEKIFYVR